ncbi:hypothetical protein [Streptomyces sp. NPDC057302]|uniref:hypothetical protein n=1 Tax=Streptomyces sp. NPDC057302 TaxID=3346094 RepID=UPI003644B00D
MPHQTEEHPHYEIAVSVHGVTVGYAGHEDGFTVMETRTATGFSSALAMAPRVAAAHGLVIDKGWALHTGSDGVLYMLTSPSPDPWKNRHA